VRLGIIGAGWPGQQHTRAILAGKSALVQACAEVDPARAAEFQKTFAPKRVYSDYQDLLGDPGADAVVICLPNFLHFPVTLAALEAGEPVLLRKAAHLKQRRNESVAGRSREARAHLFF
jgi:predicted dehydrogenase